MSIQTELQSDLKEAMKAREKEKINALRQITAAIKQVEVDERIEVDEVRMLSILNKMAKQRKESLAQFEQAGREDLAAQERFELEIIAKYLPQPLSEAELLALIDKAISDTGASAMPDMGKVMNELRPKITGRADAAIVSQLVKQRLA